ncbi:hypothetical protein EWM64_g1322 [Hericium alpestre]|uniref:MIT domain-containing protein n=1 Tax=Hericium alpestre TaxID=135208 RepID=A0A4Z0A6L5_9AGAM|nr:hypothetical protein EWM64_g1322 [Hericium alpestre]
MPRSSHLTTTRHQDIVPDRLLLSAKEAMASSSSHEPRPSSRRALTKALELAREAVKLDSTNDDPYGAVIAYGKSVALLSKVMERVMRGEDSTETHRKRGGRRRSVVAQEEEVKRLKAIHDTYADRMNILSLIYSIPPIPHSPTSLYTASISASTDSTQPSSPTTGSPSSESSDHIPFTPSLTTDDDSDGHRLSEEMTVKADGDLYLNGDLIGLPVASSAPQPYGRSRASSQPGNRPNIAGLPPASFDISARPPSSTSSIQNGGPPRKSTTSTKSHFPQITVFTGMMSPGLGTPITQLVPPPPIPHNNLPTTPMSPLPPAPPADAMRKPYHMMNLLRHTMTSKSGGYITRRLHVPHEVWSQGGAKLINLPEKVRVVEVLCSALEELQTTSGELFGGGNVSSGMAMGIGGIDKKEGDLWLAKLEEFSAVCDGVVSNFGKKLGVGEGFAVKKAGGVAAWGGRLTRRFGELTNAKNLDSPASYVSGLSKLFIQAQLLDEHSKALTMQPIAPTYAALPLDSRNGIEAKLRRSSEFFATVVLTFVIRDLAQLLDKYVKKCEKWLEE